MQPFDVVDAYGRCPKQIQTDDKVIASNGWPRKAKTHLAARRLLEREARRTPEASEEHIEGLRREKARLRSSGKAGFLRPLVHPQRQRALVTRMGALGSYCSRRRPLNFSSSFF